MGAAIVLGPSAGMFVNPASLLIVGGGTIAAVLMKFTLSQFLGAVSIAIKAFLHKSESPDALIEKVSELAAKARKEGLLSLDGEKVDNEFLQKGIGMLVDGYAPEVVREVMRKDINQTVERHNIGQKIFKAIATDAPAMGMIGTLIGLVQMLSNMSDPQSIGPAMAVALLTTLYGAMIANMVAMPIADKLAVRSQEERMLKSLVLDGLGALQAGHNPRVIQQILVSYLPRSKRPAED